MPMSTTYSQVLAVKDRYGRGLMQLPGVVGVGIGSSDRDGLAIRIYLRSADPEILGRLPQQLEGVPVLTEVVGNIVAG